MTATTLYNLENEKVVLASIQLRGTDVLEESLSAGLDPSHFFDQRHRIIYRTQIKLAADGKPIDDLSIKKALEESGQLDEVGLMYLLRLGDGMPLSLDIPYYSREIIKLAGERQIISAAANIQTAATSGNGNLATAVKDLKRALGVYESPQKTAAHAFEQIAEDRYALTVAEVGITLEVDRLRREHGELIGELCVRTSLPGVKTYDGVLSTADFNFSSARARTERVTLLTKRANVEKLDFTGYLEEFCQRVLAADRAGQPAVDLRELDRPSPDDSINCEGLSLLRRHPVNIFGDGGALKSYLALMLAGRLVIDHGLTVALFDWELAGEDHRDRLERIYGRNMPRITYVRCERPLVYELDRLRRIVRDDRINYAVHDSVAFACDGPPESAEVAGRYFRAVRQIGIGSLHLAHVTKGEGGDEKCFGSAFWHNGFRATYFIKLTDESPDGQTLNLGLFNKKFNLGKLQPPTGFKIEFTPERTHFARSNPADHPELAEKMSIRHRMIHLLRGGALPLEQVAEALDAKPDSLKRTVRRYKKIFTLLDGGNIALLQRDTESGHNVRTA